MASTPIGSMADLSGSGAAEVETSSTAEFSAAPTSRSVFFFTAYSLSVLTCKIIPKRGAEVAA